MARAFSGRVVDAVPLLERAVELSAGMRVSGRHSLLVAGLGQAYLIAGRTPEALEAARRALDLSQGHKERGHEAWVWRLLGEISLRSALAETGIQEFERALALATELEMRPLVAHSRLGLGRGHQRAGRFPEAQEHLAAAVALYGALGMRLWLGQAEAALAKLG
jgi:tetratricopeptide (TPR) repeat protein